MSKEVKIINVTGQTSGILEEGFTYEVIGEKRDEYLVDTTFGYGIYVWKNDCELIENE